ncbi:hypothetical protein [Streptomyces sp. NRRL F-5126]|uniref:hypothetical protein n=1 Tax=Streptomyces sp. NRRL F-5126 TaxID=1463857 RepID=UPI000ADFAE0C
MTGFVAERTTTEAVMSAYCRVPQSTDRRGARLPWWAVVLPSVAFFALLMVAVNPSQAHAAGGGDVLARLVWQIRMLLP